MDIPNRKKRNILRPLLVVSLLVLTVTSILNACVMPTIMPPEDAPKNATGAAEVAGSVKATVDAAIALAVKATLTSVSSNGETIETATDEGQEVAAVTPPSGEATTDDADAIAAIEPVESTEATLLITPTPDRSAEIMEIVTQNTRHFRGNPDATVVIVEFSDFL